MSGPTITDLKFTDMVLQARRTFPGMRIGQILDNALPESRTLFYVEDQDLIDFLDQYIRLQGGRQP